MIASSFEMLLLKLKYNHRGLTDLHLLIFDNNWKGVGYNKKRLHEGS